MRSAQSAYFRAEITHFCAPKQKAPAEAGAFSDPYLQLHVRGYGRYTRSARAEQERDGVDAVLARVPEAAVVLRSEAAQHAKAHAALQLRDAPGLFALRLPGADGVRLLND